MLDSLTSLVLQTAAFGFENPLLSVLGAQVGPWDPFYGMFFGPQMCHDVSLIRFLFYVSWKSLSETRHEFVERCVSPKKGVKPHWDRSLSNVYLLLVYVVFCVSCPMHKKHRLSYGSRLSHQKRKLCINLFYSIFLMVHLQSGPLKEYSRIVGFLKNVTSLGQWVCCCC